MYYRDLCMLGVAAWLAGKAETFDLCDFNDWNFLSLMGVI